MVAKSIKIYTAGFNLEDGRSAAIWKEVEPPTINELNRVDEDPYVIGLLTEKLIEETQQRKALMANSVPDEQQAIFEEERNEGVTYVPTAVKDEPTLTGEVVPKENLFGETRNVIYEVDN